MIERSNPDRVIIGAALPTAVVAALDELATKQGVTRSAMLRQLIDAGLAKTMASDPDLLARYEASPRAALKKRRRARVFCLDTKISGESV